MSTKKHLALVALTAAAGAALILSQSAWTPHNPNRLEGGWLLNTPGVFTGFMLCAPTDPSGMKAAFYAPAMTVDPGVLQQFGADSMGGFVGEAAMTGPHSGKYTCVYYFLSQGQIIWIVVDSGTATFAANNPGRVTFAHHMAIYPPTADTNGDLLPEQGSPLFCLEAAGVATRVPMLPPCNAGP